MSRQALCGWMVLLTATVLSPAAWGQKPNKLRDFRGKGAFCVLPGRRQLALVEEGPISILRVATGKREGVIGGKASGRDDRYKFRTLAASPDGKWLATGCTDCVVRLWRMDSARLQAELRGHIGRVLSLQFSPDGKLLASGDDEHVIFLWDVAERKSRARLDGHTGVVRSLDFSPDGKRLASGAGYVDGKARIWDVATGKAVQTITGHRSTVTCVAFLGDNKRLATSGGVAEKSIKLWDAATGKKVGEFACLEDVERFAISPDGKLLATDDDVIELWDLTTGTRLRTLYGHNTQINFLEFSSDSKTLVGAACRSIWAWDVPTALANAAAYTLTGSEQVSLNDLNPTLAVAYSPDGLRLATGSMHAPVRLWDLHTLKIVHRFEGDPSGSDHVVFSRDGKLLAASSNRYGSVHLWNVQTRDHVRKISKDYDAGSKFAITSDGKHIIAKGDQSVVIAEFPTGRRLATVKVSADGGAYDLAVAPDGKAFATNGKDRAIRLWDIPGGRQLRTLTPDTVGGSAIAFSTDGRWLALGASGKATLWNAASGQRVRQFVDDDCENLWFRDIEFSADDRLLAGATGNEIRLWEVNSGRLLRVFEGHLRDVRSLSFAPGGATLASGGFDRSVKFWDISDLASPAAKRRAWSDEKGQRTIEAQLLAVFQEQAILKRDGGEVVRVPLAHLSQADRQLAAQLSMRPADVNYDPRDASVVQAIVVKKPAAEPVPAEPPKPKTKVQRLIAELDKQFVLVWMTPQGTAVNATNKSDLTAEEMDQQVSLIVQIPNLVYLDLGNESLSDLAARRLNNLPQLKELDLEKSQLTDEGVKQLADLPLLEKLNLKGTKVGDAGAATLSRFGRLMELDVSFTQLTDKAVPALLGLPQLTSLQLAGTDLTDAAFLQLAKLRRLEELGVGGTNVTVEAIQDFQKLRGDVRISRYVDPEFQRRKQRDPRELEVMRLVRKWGSVKLDTERAAWPIVKIHSYRDITDDDVAPLADLKHLEQLELRSDLLTDASVKNLRGMKRLKRLHLSSPLLTDAALEVIASLGQLEDLYLATDQLSMAGLARIGRMKQLRQLWLGVAIDDQGLEHLSGLIDLERLMVTQREQTEQTLEHISKMTKLRELYLRGDNITNDGLARLSKFTELRKLILASTQATSAGLGHLRGCTHLQELHLSGSPADGANLEFFTELKILSLGDEYAYSGRNKRPNRITDASLAHLAKLTKLEQLNLSATHITDAGLAHLAALTKLQRLTLDRTQIDGQGLVHLKDCQSLDFLDLSDTKTTDAGAAHLKRLGSLRSLNLSRTEITDAGMEHLSQMIALGELDLRGTWVSRVGVEQFSKRVPDCRVTEIRVSPELAKPQQTFELAADPRALAVDPSGELLAVADRNGRLQVWNTRTGERKFRLESTAKYGDGLQFTGDGKSLLAEVDGLKLLDVADGKPRKTLLAETYLKTFASSPDGKTLAVVNSDDQLLLVEFSKNDPPKVLYDDEPDVEALAFSPDGRRLAASGEDGLLRVWDLSNRNRMTQFQGLEEDVRLVAFTPDGRQLVSGESDGKLVVWDVGTAQQVAAVENEGSFRGPYALSAGAKLVAFAGGDLGGIEVRRLETGVLIGVARGHTAETRQIAFSPDGKQLYSTGSDARQGYTVRVWDLSRRTPPPLTKD